MKYYVITLIFFFLGSSLEGQWYKEFKTKRSDPFSLSLLHSVAGPGFARAYGTWELEGSANLGKLYIVLDKVKFDEILQKGPLSYIHYRLKLDGSDREFWQKYFEEKGQVIRVPVLVSLAGTANLKIGIGITLLDALSGSSDSNTVSAAIVADLMKSGGEFVQYASIVLEGEESYIHSDVFFQTKVNNELRRYLIASSVHAVIVR